jgi:hypothetical protein
MSQWAKGSGAAPASDFITDQEILADGGFHIQ